MEPALDIALIHQHQYKTKLLNLFYLFSDRPLGGSADEIGTAIAVDSAGNAYVGGATRSNNFSTKNAYQSTFKGSGGMPDLCSSCGPLLVLGDAFLVKLNPDGRDVGFSTYLGGKLDDTITSLAMDASGNVYAGGATLSSDFPLKGAAQGTYGGAASDSAQPVIKTGDGFVAKFTAAGSLVYSTYLGGSADDAVMGIAVDGAGAAYVTGFTTSSNLPGVGANAAQKTFAGPPGITGIKGFAWGDAFVAKLAPSGDSIAYATYLGGSDDDAGMAIAVHGAGNAIVGGLANSANLKVTSDAAQKTFGGTNGSTFSDPTGDGFLAKVSADGSSLLYLSYYGGNASDAITGLALDAKGNVVVAGATTSTNLASTASAAQGKFAGEDPQLQTETMGDSFVAVFSGIGTVGAPVITSVVNGASFTASVAPGTAVVVLGTNLPASASAGALVGGSNAQVSFASATQWNLSIPTSAAPGPTRIQIGTSAPFSITLSQYAPALFSTGNSLATAVRANGSPITASAPALPGDVVTLFATGLGARLMPVATRRRSQW